MVEHVLSVHSGAYLEHVKLPLLHEGFRKLLYALRVGFTRVLDIRAYGSVGSNGEAAQRGSLGVRYAEINVAAVYYAGSAAAVAHYREVAAVYPVLFQEIVQQQEAAGAFFETVAVYAGFARLRNQVVEILRANA